MTLTTSNWKSIKVASAPRPGDFPKAVTPTSLDLLAAAKAFDARRDPFAIGKGDTCRDLASKLDRFGSYASEKQQDFARKLVEWSKPRPQAESPYRSWMPVPKLFSIMQGLADLYIGDIKIARRNQDSFCWITLFNLVVGKIENGEATVFPAKCHVANNTRPERVLELLAEIEANPLEAAKAAGRASGRCAVCGRDLTEPGSIEAGIGPTCMLRVSGGL